MTNELPDDEAILKKYPVGKGLTSYGNAINDSKREGAKWMREKCSSLLKAQEQRHEDLQKQLTEYKEECERLYKVATHWQNEYNKIDPLRDDTRYSRKGIDNL